MRLLFFLLIFLNAAPLYFVSEQDYWAQQYKIRELSSGPMRQFMIGGKSLEIGYEIASTVEGVGTIKNIGKFAFKKAFQSGGSVGSLKIPIYRVYGEGASMYGKSYSLINPKYVPFYRNFAGLPNLNSGQYLLKGSIPLREIKVGRWFAAPLPHDSNRVV